MKKEKNIKVYSFMGDKVESIALDKLKKGAKAWVRCTHINIANIRKIAAKTGIPFDEFEESFELDERPRVYFGDHVEIIYKVPSTTENEVQTIPLFIYIKGNTIVTIEKEPLSILDEFEERFKVNKGKFLFREGVGHFIFTLFDRINDMFLAYIDKITKCIDIIERRATALSEKDYEHLYISSVTSAFFNQSLIANIEVLNSLRKGYSKLFTAEDKEEFEELYHDALQILDTEKIQRELIANLFNLQDIIASNKLNRFMKKLTALALVIMVPTFMSGVYGMNFPNMPFTATQYGFYYLIGLMGLITIMLLIVFRKIEWL